MLTASPQTLAASSQSLLALVQSPSKRRSHSHHQLHPSTRATAAAAHASSAASGSMSNAATSPMPGSDDAQQSSTMKRTGAPSEGVLAQGVFDACGYLGCALEDPDSRVRNVRPKMVVGLCRLVDRAARGLIDSDWDQDEEDEEEEERDDFDSETQTETDETDETMTESDDQEGASSDLRFGSSSQVVTSQAETRSSEEEEKGSRSSGFAQRKRTSPRYRMAKATAENAHTAALRRSPRRLGASQKQQIDEKARAARRPARVNSNGKTPRQTWVLDIVLRLEVEHLDERGRVRRDAGVKERCDAQNELVRAQDDRERRARTKAARKEEKAVAAALQAVALQKQRKELEQQERARERERDRHRQRERERERDRQKDRKRRDDALEDRHDRRPRRYHDEEEQERRPPPVRAHREQRVSQSSPISKYSRRDEEERRHRRKEEDQQEEKERASRRDDRQQDRWRRDRDKRDKQPQQEPGVKASPLTSTSPLPSAEHERSIGRQVQEVTPTQTPSSQQQMPPPATIPSRPASSHRPAAAQDEQPQQPAATQEQQLLTLLSALQDRNAVPSQGDQARTLTLLQQLSQSGILQLLGAGAGQSPRPSQSTSATASRRTSMPPAPPPSLATEPTPVLKGVPVQAVAPSPPKTSTTPAPLLQATSKLPTSSSTPAPSSEETQLPTPKAPGIVHCYHCGREDPGSNGFWRKVEIADACWSSLPSLLTVRYTGAVKTDSEAAPGSQIFIACGKCGLAFNKWKEEQPPPPTPHPEPAAAVPAPPASESRKRAHFAPQSSPAREPAIKRARLPSTAQSSPPRSRGFAHSSPETARAHLFNDDGMDFDGGDASNLPSGTPGTIFMAAMRDGWTPVRRSPRKEPLGTAEAVNPYASKVMAASPTMSRRRTQHVAPSVFPSSSSPAYLGQSSTTTEARPSSVTSAPSSTTPERLEKALTNWSSDSEDDAPNDSAKDTINASPSPARRVATKLPAPLSAASEILLTKGPRSKVAPIGPFMGRSPSVDAEQVLRRNRKQSTGLRHVVSSPSKVPEDHSTLDVNNFFAPASDGNDAPDLSWVSELSAAAGQSPTRFLASFGIGVPNNSSAPAAGKQRLALPATVEDASSQTSTSPPDPGTTPGSVGSVGGVLDEFGLLTADGVGEAASQFDLSQLQEIETYGAFDFSHQLTDFTQNGLPGFAAHVAQPSAAPEVILQAHAQQQSIANMGGSVPPSSLIINQPPPPPQQSLQRSSSQQSVQPSKTKPKSKASRKSSSTSTNTGVRKSQPSSANASGVNKSGSKTKQRREKTSTTGEGGVTTTHRDQAHSQLLSLLTNKSVQDALLKSIGGSKS